MTARLLHDGAAATVHDVRCPGGSRSPGPEEESPVDQLVLVRSGTFLRGMGRQVTLADATRVLIFRRGECYRTAHPTGDGDVCTAIATWLPARLPPSLPTRPADDLAHRRLVIALARRELSPLEADEAALLLARRLVAQARRSAPAAEPPDRRVVEGARERLATRWSEPLRLADVARELGCSPFHLCRAFRRATGTTMGRHQARLRVRAALERLAGGERDLTALALDLGFYDHSHFCRVFRRELGFPPSAWRARNFVQAPR